MSAALAAILGPLSAAVLIVLLRRGGPTLALLGALAAALAAFASLPSTPGGALHRASYEWLPGLSLSIHVDPLGALLSATVAGVGFFVLLYAVGYMAAEPARDSARFYAAMSFFLAAMQVLVLAGDWVLFLGAWELIALASYLLIGYWYQRKDAKAAATRAFLTTRAADIGLYLAVFLLVHESGSTVIAETMVAETLSAAGPTATAAGLLLLLAAAGKAAQVPFQGWLAAAMAGPTPVSALLHSATLVAAGVILMLRAFPLMPAGVLLVVGALGGLTAVVAGLTALAERDLKRLLAASTSSQLGLMLVALGAGSLPAAAFHLVAHAAMKSALFLAAGVFQHARGSTEFGRLGGVGTVQPLAYAGFAVAGLALAGLPPLAGFWSKDAVLAAAFHSATPWLLFPLALVGSLLTAMYVARALRLLLRREVSGAGSPDGRTAGTYSARADAASTGTPKGAPRSGIWMGAGLAALAVAAALLGVLAGSLERLLGAELPEESWAVASGVVVAAVGLTGGWLLPAERLLGSLRPLAESGFRIAGGISALVAQPALRLALAIGRLDESVHRFAVATAGNVLRVALAGDRLSTALHALFSSVGWRTLAAAERVSSADLALHHFVEGAGRASLAAARSVQLSDRAGIEALIAGLSRGIRELGSAARRLQSGLVHRELALTVASVAGLLVLLALRGLFTQG